jgi:hypothetical protein
MMMTHKLAAIVATDVAITRSALRGSMTSGAVLKN